VDDLPSAQVSGEIRVLRPSTASHSPAGAGCDGRRAVHGCPLLAGPRAQHRSTRLSTGCVRRSG